MMRTLTALVVLLLPYQLYACNEGSDYIPPIVDKALLRQPWTGETGAHLDTRYGEGGWQADENHLITLDTPRIPDNYHIVPVTISWPPEIHASSVEIIEVSKVNHTLASFDIGDSVSSVAFRYQRLQKQSRLIAILITSRQVLVSQESIKLVGGHPCTRTVYLSSAQSDRTYSASAIARGDIPPVVAAP